ncbi:hypothetical protein PUN28_019039 [Cardiocondyla obscurior]|uniref:Uncharacterized protein n=1 Tax=Cardiocondyla obscurior TaxID=286306 RepID=A0AAW2EJ16_9HYME
MFAASRYGCVATRAYRCVDRVVGAYACARIHGASRPRMRRDNAHNRTCAPTIYKPYARCNRSYKQFNYREKEKRRRRTLKQADNSFALVLPEGGLCVPLAARAGSKADPRREVVHKERGEPSLSFPLLLRMKIGEENRGREIIARFLVLLLHRAPHREKAERHQNLRTPIQRYSGNVSRDPWVKPIIYRCDRDDKDVPSVAATNLKCHILSFNICLTERNCRRTIS